MPLPAPFPQSEWPRLQWSRPVGVVSPATLALRTEHSRRPVTPLTGRFFLAATQARSYTSGTIPHPDAPMTYALPLPEPTVIPVADGSLFPVRRVLCVARNYAAHAREMGGDPNREPPFFFSKPTDAVTRAAAIPFPSATKNLHHEVELVVAIAKGGANIPAAQALDHVFGYTVGLDLTRRDLQEEAKKAGRPWDMAKGFDLSAPVGVLRPAAEIGHPAQGEITLAINGQPRQHGDLSDMIWSVAEVISHLSGLVALAPGDIIFTGTPEGVGAIQPGDRLDAHIDGVGDLGVVVG